MVDCDSGSAHESLFDNFQGHLKEYKHEIDSSSTVKYITEQLPQATVTKCFGNRSFINNGHVSPLNYFETRSI